MYRAIALPSARKQFGLPRSWGSRHSRAPSTLARAFTCALLLSALQVVSSPKVESQDFDPFGKATYDETITLATLLAEVQPTTMWESPIDGEAADLVEYITDDRLVVGVMEVAGNGTPRHGPLYMVDANDGSLLWEYDRERIGTGSYSLLHSAPFLLLVGIAG